MARRWLSSLIPAANDILAVAVIVAVYFIRIGSAGDPAIDTPGLLIVTTDFVLPTLAGSWLWVAGMFVLIQQVSEGEK